MNVLYSCFVEYFTASKKGIGTMQQLTLPPQQKKIAPKAVWANFQQFMYLIQYPCQAYPRVSTPGQKNNVSAEMLQDKRFALLCGWADQPGAIILEKDDLGVSGQLRMDEREAFVKMLRNIAAGIIKAVIVANISRFFRRKWNDEAEKFMMICETYGVKVIVPNPTRTAIKKIYDFSRSGDIQDFRRECEEAWNYLENHIYGTMLAAQDVLGQIGRWGGWNLPPGYIVDRREKIDGEFNPDYRLYIPYPPHAEIVDHLHDGFWQLNFNTMVLLREIGRLEYLFPAFEPWVDKEFHNKLPMTKVFDEEGKIKGYTITSDHGLRSILSNRMSIGYAVWKGEVVSNDNHEAIVDYNKFALSYNHISPIRLDGTPNEWVMGRRQTYAKKHDAVYFAILDGKLQASDPCYRINLCTKPIKQRDRPVKIERYYGFYRRRRSEGFASKYMIVCRDVDRIFLDHFIMRLQQADEFENFLDAEKAELAIQAQMLLDLDIQIAGAKKAMAQKKAYLDSGKIKNLNLLEGLDAAYTQLEQDVAQMERQREKIAGSKTTAQQRRSYKQMMREAGDCWEEVVTPEEIPLMIDAFVDKVKLDPVAPHFYTMAIHWSDPDWGIDELTCYRDGCPSTRWTQEERDILRKRYETAPMEELFQLLPRRNYISLQKQAEISGLRRQHQLCPRHLPKAFCFQDWEIMQQCGVTEEELLISKGGRLVTLASPMDASFSNSNWSQARSGRRVAN